MLWTHRKISHVPHISRTELLLTPKGAQKELKRMAKLEDVTPRNVGVAGGLTMWQTIVSSRIEHATTAVKLDTVRAFVQRQSL